MDDLTLFCKSDLASVMLLIRGLKTFSLTSGLEANSEKSALYCGNVQPHIKTQLLGLTGFQEGKLPFRYLRIPIAAKKINASDCECLVDKIRARIKYWGSRNLSYVARVQLINSILMSTHTYWATIFMLPKCILKEIVSVCRSFLWAGKENTSKASPIAWDNICKPRLQGGLNVRNILICNKAAMGKYIWEIAMKEDNLWVKWIHGVYIREEDVWTHNPPPNASWYWRKLCAIKHQFRARYTNNKWMLNTKGVYKVAETYRWLSHTVPKVPWRYWVWNKLNVPKHSFVCWMTMWDRLKTRDKLCNWGL